MKDGLECLSRVLVAAVLDVGLPDLGVERLPLRHHLQRVEDEVALGHAQVVRHQHERPPVHARDDEDDDCTREHITYVIFATCCTSLIDEYYCMISL